jgi:uncharacterized membrane protein
MLAELSIDLFTRDGLAYLARWGHVLVGIAWIGLLYFFNLVQVPAFAEMEAAARNNALDKLTWRALWWFRWAAAATFAFGVLILLLQRGIDGSGVQLFDMDYWKTSQGISILTGILLGTTMFLNVWGVIWRNQRVVIANARNVQAGGEANPDAPAAGRRALMASRQNMIFSIPMLIFMVGTAHFPYEVGFPGGGSRAIYWLVTLVVFALFELNALGYLGGTGTGGPRTIYDTHHNALWTGFIYGAVSLGLFMVLLRA